MTTETKKTKPKTQKNKTRTKKSTKRMINIIVLVLIIIILGIILYSNLTTTTHKYKLDLDNITFYSDGNILQQINTLKDSNTVYVIVDQTLNKNYILGNTLLFTEAFVYNRKTVFSFIIGNDDSCSYTDGNMHTYNTTKQKCLSILAKVKDPKVMLGAVEDKKKPEVIISKNTFFIVSTSVNNAQNENYYFLKTLYPNLDEIFQRIKAVAGKLIGKANPKTTLPTSN